MGDGAAARGSAGRGTGRRFGGDGAAGRGGRQGGTRRGDGAAGRAEAARWAEAARGTSAKSTGNCPICPACDYRAVGTRQRLADVGASDARRIIGEVAREIGVARLASGTSQRQAARRAGLSPSQYGRIERGEVRRLTVEDASRAARAVGLRCGIRCFPSDLRTHDAAQLGVLGRFVTMVAKPLGVEREVGLPIPGDLRAWDARITDGRRNASVDAESRVGDLQALARRTGLKQRDDPAAGAIILVLARTANNRAVLREHREALRAQFPLDGAAIARALRRGELPQASGIILV
jgi:hypothetical protein